MKRYIKLILVGIFSLSLIIFLFFLLIKQDNNYITYIRLQVNPNFILGINKDRKVVFYNALNEDAGKYNLSMFQGKSLDEAINVFIEKYGVSKEGKDEIFLSIMTKNHQLENDIYSIIQKAIMNYDGNYKVLLNEPTNEELERFSGEVVYNLKNTLTNEDLKEIGRIVNKELNKYVENQINKLKMDKLTNEQKKQMLEEKIDENYFNDFILTNIKLNRDDITFSKRSNYNIDFVFNEDNTYQYKTQLNLELDYEKIDEKVIIEVYKYIYEQGEDIEYIRDLTNYYYSY